MSKSPKGAWQYYERLPRPALRWVCLFGSAWAMGICDALGFPMDSATRGVCLAFVAGVYGLRGWEKLREPKPATDPLAFDPYAAPDGTQDGTYK